MDKKLIPIYLVALYNGFSILLAVYLAFTAQTRFELSMMGILFLVICTHYLLKREFLPWIILIIWNILLIPEFESEAFNYGMNLGYTYKLSLSNDNFSIGMDLMPFLVLILLLFCAPAIFKTEKPPATNKEYTI